MITLQHAALYAWTLLNVISINSMGTFLDLFRKQIPWVLLPDGIRAYSGPRQLSHFEQNPSGTDVSWMEFPTPETLQKLSKDNFSEKVCYYMADGYIPSVIGDETHCETFWVHNWNHHFASQLGSHLAQDIVMDNVLRKDMVDISGRFKDHFVPRHDTSKVLDGKQLRNQIAKFEMQGFLYLIGKIYENSGLLLDREWFDSNVETALRSSYPQDLAESTYHYMKIGSELDARIHRGEFMPTTEEKESIIICKDLVETFDHMYAEAFEATKEVIK